tara:strand:+ start:490 stop:720 length:231 start_codon:yes stop_codon:yes gene_type:complete
MNQKQLAQKQHKRASKLVKELLKYSMVQHLFRRYYTTVQLIQKRARIYMKGRQIQSKTVKNMLITELENLKKQFES